MICWVFDIMMNNREYHTLRFFRGKKRNNAELAAHTEADIDFNYRRLIIKEYELDLHVQFSRMTIYSWLAWSFLLVAFFFFQHLVLTSILFGLSVLSGVLSIIYKRRFRSTFRDYHFILSIVDSVIFRNTGIRLLLIWIKKVMSFWFSS